MEDYKAWAAGRLDAVKGKMASVVARNAHKIPYLTENGRYNDKSDEIGWWTNGFWGGLLWEEWLITGDDQYKDQKDRKWQIPAIAASKTAVYLKILHKSSL